MADVAFSERAGRKMLWQIQVVREDDQPTKWRLTVNHIVQGEYDNWHLAEKERRRLASGWTLDL